MPAVLVPKYTIRSRQMTTQARKWEEVARTGFANSIRIGIEAAASEMETAYRIRAPYDDRPFRRERDNMHLRDTIGGMARVEASTRFAITVVTSQGRKARWLRYGTKDHDITPRGPGYQLHFFWHKQGHFVRYWRVHHTGTKANRWEIDAMAHSILIGRRFMLTVGRQVKAALEA